MRPDDLPIRWKDRLAKWVGSRSAQLRSDLLASDFPIDQVVHLEFPDKSSVAFRYAFVIEAPDIGEVAVFTEHCGYHVFPLADTSILTEARQ